MIKIVRLNYQSTKPRKFSSEGIVEEAAEKEYDEQRQQQRRQSRVKRWQRLESKGEREKTISKIFISSLVR